MVDSKVAGILSTIPPIISILPYVHIIYKVQKDLKEKFDFHGKRIEDK